MNIKVYYLLVAFENLGRPELFGWKSHSFPRCSILYDMMSTRHSQLWSQVLISEVQLVDRWLQIKYHIRDTTAWRAMTSIWSLAEALKLKAVNSSILYKSLSDQNSSWICYSNFKSFINKSARIFWSEKLSHNNPDFTASRGLLIQKTFYVQISFG